MQLRFIRGDAQAPRGHAIVIARPYGQPIRALATYCIVLPIQFSLGRYIPPILASQLPLGGFGDLEGGLGVMPVPPMLEDIPDIDELIRLAELRDDDVVELDGIELSNDARRMEIAAEASGEYGQLYTRYTASKQTQSRGREAIGFRAAPREETPTIVPEQIESLLSEAAPGSDREQLSEISRLIGTLRYAVDGHDQRQVDETTRALRRAAAPLSEKYHPEELIDAALKPGVEGQKLAELYLARAYKLADEDYTSIRAIEEQIKQLRGE